MIKNGNSSTGESISAKMIGDKPNPRFVATMLHHSSKLIDNGHKIRLIGHEKNGMFNHYHKLAKIIGKKKGYEVGEPRSHSDTSSANNSNEFKEVTVSKPT